MSLLMEALRKAEQVKKQAADDGHLPDTGVRVEITNVPDAATPPAASGINAAAPPAPSHLGNEPLTIETHTEEAEPSEEARVVIESWEVPENEGETTPLEEPVTAIPLLVERPVMESSAVPLAAVLSAPIIAPAEVPPPVVIAGHEPPGGSPEASRQAAHVVFLAKSRHKRQVFRLRVLCYGLLLVLGILGAAGFLYMSSGNMPMHLHPVPAANVPPPSVEPMEPQPKQLNAEVPAPVAVVLVNAGKQESRENGVDKHSSSSGALLPIPGTGGRPTTSTAVEKPATPVVVPVPLAGTDLHEASILEPRPLTASGMEAVAPPPSISITKRSAAPQNDVLLAAANGAFEQGQYQQSRSRYQQLLQVEPDHRGALLGLAALAVRGQDPALARDLYLRLLTRDPSDPLAKAGLLSVMAGGDPARLESELKLLLEVHPDLAPPFFLLGNLYAAGQRWNEAQQAYFNAVQAAGKSGTPTPDYSFNLAVSLEHMGQLALAVRYYRDALRLAEHRPAGFDREGLKGRLVVLDPGGGNER